MAGHDAHPVAGVAEHDWKMAEHWPELVVAITDQAIESVDLLLRGLDWMVQRGKLSPAEFHVLATPAQRLKHCGVHAQQIVRFQSGQVRQSHEKIDLAFVVESVLQERRDTFAMQGITVRRECRPIELLIDPTLGYSLAQAMLDWSVRFGPHLDVRLTLTTEDPARGRLAVRVLTPATVSAAEVMADGIQWLLLRQIAATDGGIELQRNVVADGVELTAWFKRVLTDRAHPPTAESAAATPKATHAHRKTFALVCSAAPDVRRKAVGIVQALGVGANGAASGAQVTASLRDRDVHLLILDEEHPPADITQLRLELADRQPDLAVLRLVAPTATQRDGSRGNPAAVMAQTMKVPIDAMDESLGSCVLLALSNGL